MHWDSIENRHSSNIGGNPSVAVRFSQFIRANNVSLCVYVISMFNIITKPILHPRCLSQFPLSSSFIGRIYNLGEFHFCVHLEVIIIIIKPPFVN